MQRCVPTPTTRPRWRLAIEHALAERERLAEAGLEHARGFTWRAAGEIFLRGYERARR